MVSNLSLLRNSVKVVSLNHVPLVEMPFNVQEPDIENLDRVLDFIYKSRPSHIIFDYCKTISIETKALSELSEICERLGRYRVEVIFWSLSPKILRQISNCDLIKVVVVDTDTNFVLPFKQARKYQIVAKIINIFRPKRFHFC